MKLTLDRDFTRFINDPTFPYKVTVCIGDERILCSGALLAQQSSVLEKKFREDDGVLMFEEIVDVENGKRALHECIRYLHGKDLSFTSENIAVVLKFASYYKVTVLFNNGLEWLKVSLNSSKSAKDVVEFLKLSNFLDQSDSARLKSMISTFIGLNKQAVGSEIGEFLELGVTGFDMALIMEQNPSCSGSILKKWCSIAIENQKFILDNHSLLSFKDIFPSADEFSVFVASISGESQSVDTMRALLDIQKLYFTAQGAKDNKSTESISQKAFPQPGPSEPVRPVPASSQPVREVYRTYVAPAKSPAVPRPVPAACRPNPLNNPLISRILRYGRYPTNQSNIGVKQPGRPFSAFPSSSLSLGPNMNCCDDTSENDSLRILISNIPNIPKLMRKQDLMWHFKDFGKIDNLDWNVEEGTAVLTYQDSNSVSNLIAASPGISLYGHGIQYEVYSDSESEYDSTEVYVGNLPASVSKRKLLQLFKFAGRISNVNIDKENSTAILSFEDVESSIRLLECGRRFMLDGNELEVEECASSSSEDEEETSTLFVGNVPKETTNDELKRLFAGFGKINEFTIKNGRNKRKTYNYALVEYETVGSALAVIKASQVKNFEIRGTALKIELKKNN
ncbi:uncharacterized protein LOC134822950 [Bolinopsis microptera]|uniref:uncharacterized protein LOC134822950 n=1 Tax=Bolinopsis microptera TaxID=2820187 RepID=UPI00307968AA